MKYRGEMATNESISAIIMRQKWRSESGISIVKMAQNNARHHKKKKIMKIISACAWRMSLIVA